MFIMAEWIVLLALGNQWTGVIPVIRILAIAIPVQVVLSTSGSFFHAMNWADLLLLSRALSPVIMVGGSLSY
jgi:O-antigen/teichoic acid export membrane protein